jgi:hypothetical protein
MTQKTSDQATAFMLSAIVPAAPIFMVAFNLGASL